MNPELKPALQSIGAVLDQCLDHIRFARAAELARSGRYVAAEALLSLNGRSREAPRELDLLARIEAQQRHLSAARRLWEKALQFDPKNADYKECLVRLTRLELVEPPAQIAPSVIIWAAVVGALALTGLIWLKFSPRFTRQETTSVQPAATPIAVTPQPEPARGPQPDLGRSMEAVPPPKSEHTPVSSPRSSPTPQDLSLVVDRLQGSFDQLRQGQEHQSESVAVEIRALQTNQASLLENQIRIEGWLANLFQSSQSAAAQQSEIQHLLQTTRSELQKLAEAHQKVEPPPSNQPISSRRSVPGVPKIPGVTVVSQNYRSLYVFDSGVFDRDDHFKPGSKALVTATVKALVQTQQKVRLEIIGFAHQEPPTWPWLEQLSDSELGLKRAKRVSNHIHSLGIVPSNAVSALAGSRDELPFLSPNTNDRTVILWISYE